MQIVIAALLVIFLSVPQQPTSGKGKEPLKKNETPQKEQTQNCPPVAVQCYPQTQYPQAQSNEANAESKNWMYRAYLISGPIIGVVTVGTLIVVWKQIRTMRQIERAWLVVTTESPHNMSKAKGGWIFQGFGFEWYIKNCGKTPAFIVQVGARIQSVKTLDDLPREPLIEDCEFFPYGGMSVGPGEVIPRFTMAAQGDKQPSTVQELADFNAGKFNWVAYGVVKYRIALARGLRETRFCYIWTPNKPEKFTRSPLPEKYTKQT